MTERPILFSAPMVQALLQGRKVQTRRLCKPQLAEAEGLWQVFYPWGEGGHGIYATLDEARQEYDRLLLRHCPYGRSGDRLWVRETFVSGTMAGGHPWARYRADEPDDLPAGTKWRPSIFMPRWASRLTLEVTGVRVQQLQSITEDDARAEGVTDRAAFERLWGEIHGPESWEANPWVWAVGFRRVP